MAMSSEGKAQPKGGPKVSARLVAIGILAVLALVFVFQNGEKGTIQFLFVDVTVRIWVALLVALVLGAVIGFLVRGSGKKKG